MTTELEDRLVRMGDAVAPGDAATARARAAVLDALPAPRRGRAWGHLMPRRRALSAAFAVAGTVAIAAVLVLSLPRGGDGPAGGGIALVATAPVPGATVDPAELRTAADMIDRRAEIMRIDGADAEVVGDGIVLHLPDDAPGGALLSLTARGEFAIYDTLDVTDGPVGGTRTRPSPGPGQRVLRIDDAQAGPSYLLVDDRPGITNADIASVTPAGDLAPGIAFEATLTAAGRGAYHRLTRAVSQEGAIRKGLAVMTVAIDGVVVANPTVDPERFPDGIVTDTMRVETGAPAPVIAGDAQVAQILEGSLPVVLTPAG